MPEQQQQQQDEEGTKDKQQQQQQQPSRYQPAPPSNPRPPRHNKLYRTPPTPTNDTLVDKERSFVLDSVATSSISLDYSRANPKLGSALPTYNSQKDAHVRPYFHFRGVPTVLMKNKQKGDLSTSIEGRVYDDFGEKGPGHRYMSKRPPCGYSNEERMGHSKLFVHPNPTVEKLERKPRELEGFSGRFGYRRTTPALRQFPSPFGVNTDSEIY